MTERRLIEIEPTSLPDFRHTKVEVRPVRYDAETECYYQLKADEAKLTSPDVELALREFAELPIVPDSLLQFQNEHGLITSLKREVVYDGGAFFQAEMLPYGMTYDESDEVRERLERKHGKLAYFATEQEVSSTVGELQEVICAIAEANKVVLPDAEEYSALNSSPRTLTLHLKRERARRAFMNSVSLVSAYYPIARVAPRPGDVANEQVVPLSVALIVNLLSVLSSGYGVRECPECGRGFVFKRDKSNKTVLSIRGPQSIYCSAKCQRSKNDRKWSEKRTAERKDRKRAGEVSADA